MSILSRIAGYAHSIREFLLPSYRPERHYMRGPGPACARRAARKARGEPGFSMGKQAGEAA